MSGEILDENFHANNEINNLDDIKKALQQAGITSFFEHKNGSIIVEQGDAVKVTITYKDGLAIVKPNFPSIGNSIQIIASGVFLAFSMFIISTPFPFPWIIAIAGGQLVSYLVHQPKTKKLKTRIEQYI